MSQARLDKLHPRFIKAAPSFFKKDKALVLKVKPFPLLLTTPDVRFAGNNELDKHRVNSSSEFIALLQTMDSPVSVKELYTYFADTPPAATMNPHQMATELVKQLKDGSLILYHWYYSTKRYAPRAAGKYDGNASAPAMPKGILPSSKTPKLGGYVPPFVPTLAELDEIAAKLKNLSQLDGDALKSMGLNAIKQNVLGALPEKLDPIKDILTGLANGGDLKDLLKNKALNSLPDELDPINDILAGLANGADMKALLTDKALAMVGSTPTGLATPPFMGTPTAGEPISLVTGEELLQLTDFTLNGPMPLVWSRIYRTTNPYDGGLGHGWTHPLDESLSIDVDNERLSLIDAEGRHIPFPLPEVGERVHNTAERLTLLREDDHAFVITPYSSPYGTRRYFHWVDEHYRLTAIKNSHSAGYELSYHEQKLIKVSSSQGDSLLFDYTPCGHIASITKENIDGGLTTQVSYHYSAEGDLIQSSDNEGFGEHYQYQHHIITRRQIKSGYRFYFEWDQLSHQAKCIRQWGDTINGQATYDYRFEWLPEQGQVTVTDTRGGQEVYRHNADAKLVYHQDAQGHATHHIYDDRGQHIRSEFADGSSETYHYNEFGQQVGITDSLGRTQMTEYDDVGRISARIDHLDNRWQYEYNDHNQLSEVINPEGHRTRYTYNILGLLGTVTNGAGHSVRYWWNERAQLTQQVDAMGRATQYAYNEHHQLSEVRHSNGHSTRYEYNARGQISAVTTPDNHTTQYRYTALGHLASSVDAHGTHTEYVYDGLSQVVKRIITDKDGQQSSLAYDYDGERNLVGIVNEKGERYQLDYDNNERLIKEVGFDGRTTTYDYDSLGHI